MLETSFVQSAVRARQLAEKLKVEGYPTKSILAEAGIDARVLNTTGAMLPFEKIATLFERASGVSGDDCLGFRFAQSRDVRDAGLLGYIGLSSPTVLAALRNLEHYSRVFSDAIEFQSGDLEETGGLWASPSQRSWDKSAQQKGQLGPLMIFAADLFNPRT